MIAPVPAPGGCLAVCRRCDDPAGDDRDARGLCYFCACDVDGHVCWTDDTLCHWCGAAQATSCLCYCHAEGSDGTLCLDCRHVHRVSS